MKTLKLIWHILQFPEIDSFYFINDNIGDDVKLTQQEAIKNLSAYWDADMKWRISRIENSLCIYPH